MIRLIFLPKNQDIEFLSSSSAKDSASKSGSTSGNSLITSLSILVFVLPNRSLFRKKYFASTSVGFPEISQKLINYSVNLFSYKMPNESNHFVRHFSTAFRRNHEARILVVLLPSRYYSPKHHKICSKTDLRQKLSGYYFCLLDRQLL